jgi:hypothetical protein
MRSIWGPVTEIRDLGVVAEQCPYCQRVVPCLLRSVCSGHYVIFMKVAASTTESSCLCTACLKALAGAPWRYAAVVPIRTAKALPIEELLARTNPGLVERLQFKEQIVALGGDADFAVAYEQIECIRPGALRSRLLKQLLHWNELSVEKRHLLRQQIGSHARAWQFACQMAPAFPGPAVLPAILAACVVWSAFLWIPAVHSWLWASITLTAGLLAGALARHLLVTRNVRQWTRKVLIPEAQEANVSLVSLVAVVDDVPGSRLGIMEEVWPIKIELETIRRVLYAEEQQAKVLTPAQKT